MAQTTLDQRMLGVGTALTDHTITASDVITFADVGDSNLTKKDTVQGVLDLAGGIWSEISNATFSTEASVTLTSGLSSSYTQYKLMLYFTSMSNDAVELDVQFQIGGSLITASNYIWSIHGYSGAGEDRHGGGNGDSKIKVIRAYDQDQSGYPAYAEMTLLNPNISGIAKVSETRSFWYDNVSTNMWSSAFGTGAVSNTGTVDGIKFYPSAGTITGEYWLLGLTLT